MECPTSVHSDLQVRRINIILSVLSSHTLLSVSDGKYWFRLLSKGHTYFGMRWKFYTTHTHSSERKLKGSLLHMCIHRNLDSIYILIFISIELKQTIYIYIIYQYNKFQLNYSNVCGSWRYSLKNLPYINVLLWNYIIIFSTSLNFII